jgi:hypothetical protein
MILTLIKRLDVTAIKTSAFHASSEPVVILKVTVSSEGKPCVDIVRATDTNAARALKEVFERGTYRAAHVNDSKETVCMASLVYIYVKERGGKLVVVIPGLNR